MLKLKVSGTKNDLKTFKKWLERTKKIPPFYDVKCNPDFFQNPKNEKYYRCEADLLIPSEKRGVNRKCAK